MARVKQALFRFQPFSKKQTMLLTWWLPESGVSHYQGIIADGAIRSGKTVSMSLSFVLWAMEIYVEQNFAMCGKTIGSFRRNVLSVLKLMLRARGYKVKDHRADNLVEVTKDGVTNYFYIFGGKDERSQDLIQGITLAGVFFDEVALMPESFVNQATGRCSVAGSKFWFNCNPQGPAHYFKKEWIDKADEKGLLYIHFTMDDNSSLSDEIKARYRSMYTGVFYKRYIQGLWVAAEGVIYDLFADNKSRFIITDEQIPPIRYATIGVDFGGTGSAHSFTLTGLTYNWDVIVLDEFYHDNREKGRLSPERLNSAFIDFVRRAQSKYRVFEAYCDSAEQTLIEGMTVAVARAGVGIDIRNALKGPINDRIAFYNSIMAQDRFKVTEKCHATISALENAVFSGKDPTQDERLDDGTVNVDSLDSLEYSTEKVMNEILYLKGI